MLKGQCSYFPGGKEYKIGSLFNTDFFQMSCYPTFFDDLKQQQQQKNPTVILAVVQSETIIKY